MSVKSGASAKTASRASSGAQNDDDNRTPRASETNLQNNNTSRVSSHHSQPQQANSRTNSKQSAKQNGNDTPLSIHDQTRVSQANAAQLNGSRASLRSNKSIKSTQSEVLPFIDDAPRRYTADASERDLINKSRNGFIGTVYISDVKQYFDHPSFDGMMSETNKKYLEDLLSDFRKLLKTTIDRPDDTLHDVEFFEEDSDQVLPGHSQLLTARSATFEALFKKLDAGESEYLGFRLVDESDRIKRIQLPSDDPKLTRDLMEASLHYMYWGNIDSNLINEPEKLEAYFEVASFLDLKEFRRHLATQLFEYLKSKASGSLAIKYLKLAVKCGCKYLKKESIDYIVRFKGTILRSKSWEDFVAEKENKELVKEIYQRMVEKSNPSNEQAQS